MNSSLPPRTVNRSVALVLFFGALVVVSVLVTLGSLWLLKPTPWAHDQPHGHQWLHEELGLTEAEAARIDAFEPAYRTERQRLQKEFDRQIQKISRLLQTHDSFAPEVEQAIHELHAVHAQLQQLAIEHYFDMLSVLPPDKQARLRALAAEALSVPQ